MGGFEHYVVTEPPDSRAVKALIDAKNTDVQLTLLRQHPETVIPIRPEEPITTQVKIDTAKHGQAVNSYVGTTVAGSTVTLTVFVSPELSSQPAKVTLVRGPHSITP